MMQMSEKKENEIIMEAALEYKLIRVHVLLLVLSISLVQAVKDGGNSSSSPITTYSNISSRIYQTTSPPTASFRINNEGKSHNVTEPSGKRDSGAVDMSVTSDTVTDYSVITDLDEATNNPRDIEDPESHSHRATIKANNDGFNIISTSRLPVNATYLITEASVDANTRRDYVTTQLSVRNNISTSRNDGGRFFWTDATTIGNGDGKASRKSHLNNSTTSSYNTGDIATLLNTSTLSLSSVPEISSTPPLLPRHRDASRQLTSSSYMQWNTSVTEPTQHNITNTVSFQDDISDSDTEPETIGSTDITGYNSTVAPVSISPPTTSPIHKDQTTVRNLSVRSSHNSYSTLPTQTSPAGYTQAFVQDVQFKAYRIAIPIFISIGVVVNITCILVLLKPRMQHIPANKYFCILAISDLMVCLLYIPIALTTNGCSISSYGVAVYYGRFAWSTIEICQSMSFYILLFLSYDRFIAVWSYQYFKRRNAQKVLQYRMIITVTINILFHLILFINVKIECKDKLSVYDCKPDRFFIEDSYRKNDHQDWHEVYFVIHELVVRWLPGVLLVVFNVGLVIAIATGRLNNPASSLRSKGRKEFRLTVTLISITCSFISCTFPTAIYTVWLAANIEKKCYGKHEVFRAVSNNLQLLEHIVHIVFLALLNPNFREELVNFFLCRASTDTSSDVNQSSRDQRMYQIHRQSGHSPYPGRSPKHSPHPSRRFSSSPTNAPVRNSLGPQTRF